MISSRGSILGPLFGISRHFRAFSSRCAGFSRTLDFSCNIYKYQYFNTLENRDCGNVQQRPGRGVENNGGDKMAVARVTEIIASSTKGFEDAINEGLDRANKTIRGITGIHVVSMKAAVEAGKISEYRVQMNITFILEE